MNTSYTTFRLLCSFLFFFGGSAKWLIVVLGGADIEVHVKLVLSLLQKCNYRRSLLDYIVGGLIHSPSPSTSVPSPKIWGGAGAPLGTHSMLTPVEGREMEINVTNFSENTKTNISATFSYIANDTPRLNLQSTKLRIHPVLQKWIASEAVGNNTI